MKRKPNHSLRGRCGDRYLDRDETSRPSTVCVAHPSGLTILEVLLALAIFLGAMISLSQLIGTGSQAASRSQLQTEAVFRTDSKLAEIIAGIEPMESSGPNPFPDDTTDQWSWTLEIGEGPHIDLLALNLRVDHVSNVDQINASHSVTRYLRDPQIYLDAALDEATEDSMDAGE